MPQRSLFTVSILDKLVKNFRLTEKARAAGKDEPDHVPVVKVFTPDGAATWLFTEYNPQDKTLFGLCDLGLGTTEIGPVSMAELLNLRGRLGLKVERDAWFKATKPLSWYTDRANEKDRIVYEYEVKEG